MVSTSGFLGMSLRKFDWKNSSFWKEQIQDYLIVRGQIDFIENSPAHTSIKLEKWNWLDWIARATIRMHLSVSVTGVLHRAIVRDQTQPLVNAPQYLREEGEHNKHLSDPTPLQFTDKGIRFSYIPSQYV